MLRNRRCAFFKPGGQQCLAFPVGDGALCFWHSPDHASEAQEARRLGGMRRKREHTVAGAYGFSGLESVADIRRLMEIAVLDTLGLENSVARNRTLAYLAQTATRLLETGDLEQRVATLEAFAGSHEQRERRSA